MALCAQWRRRGVDNRREGQALGPTGRWRVLRGNRRPFGDQEAEGGDAQGGMVMKPPPSPSPPAPSP